MTTPVEIVERQLAAYNDRDLARFVACYSDDVTVTRLPAAEPALRGKAAFAEFYATQRFNRPGLRAEIVGRLALGNKVVDHERVHGLAAEPLEIVVVYEVADGLIRRVWMHAAQ